MIPAIRPGSSSVKEEREPKRMRLSLRDRFRDFVLAEQEIGVFNPSLIASHDELSREAVIHTLYNYAYKKCFSGEDVTAERVRGMLMSYAETLPVKVFRITPSNNRVSIFIRIPSRILKEEMAKTADLVDRFFHHFVHQER